MLYIIRELNMSLSVQFVLEYCADDYSKFKDECILNFVTLPLLHIW